MKKATQKSITRYRWTVASRVLAASVGGYALTSLMTAVLSLGLPLLAFSTRAEAVLTATLWSFVLYTGIVIFVFSTRSHARAWSGLIMTAAALALVWLALPNAS